MCSCTCIRAGLSASAEVAQIRPDDNPKSLVTIEREPMIGETPNVRSITGSPPIPSSTSETTSTFQISGVPNGNFALTEWCRKTPI